MFTKTILFLLTMAILPLYAEVPLVKDGKPLAEIVLPQKASDVEKFAASELRYWIKEITGAELPIVAQTTTLNNSKIMLGHEAAKEYSKDLRKLKNSDGYAFRNNGSKIYIFGTTPKGTLNGVFRFIEANSDLIWSRPMYTVFTKTKNLNAKQLNVIDIPVSTKRGWNLCLAGANKVNQVWEVRSCNNFLNVNHLFRKEWGMIREIGGHMFSRIIDGNKYFKSNPEIFPILHGVRQKDYGKRLCLCLSAKSLPAIYWKEISTYIDTHQPMDCLRLCVDDSWNFCECPECSTPIILLDGTVITKKDPSFRSTLWFKFVNKIAEKIWEKYHIQTLVYAYIYLAEPPKIRISDHIIISFCIPTHNGKIAFEDFIDGKDSGTNPAPRIIKFSKMAKNVRIRDYYGCNGGFPRPDEYVAQKNIRFAVEHGVREFSSEHPVDKIDKRFFPQPAEYWDADAITVWTINRLWWNPNQDLETLRNHFLTRTFREGAPAMKKYYKLIHDQWFGNTKEISTYSDNMRRSMKRHIIETGLETRAREYLKEAEKAVRHPVSAELVKRARANFELGCNVADRIIVKKVKQKPAMNDPKWLKTSDVSNFLVLRHPKELVPMQTNVRMLHDAKNLYVKIDCQNSSSKNPSPAIQADQWIPGDFISLHFAGLKRKGVYTFGFDRYGNWFDAKRMNLSWNSGMKIERSGNDTHFTLLVSIPLSALKFEFGKDVLSRIYGVFHRRFTTNGVTISVTNDSRLPGVPRFYKEIFLEK